ncbi:MAG: rhodanese-like domain-containing protein [Bacteroidales bacterium]|nr:rhodanese-like domain-containing protein [Bacteroidales bacterium]
MKKPLFTEFSEELHEAMTDDSRYAGIDKVAFHLINPVQSTNVELIDVRSQDEFNKFSLPGAINIPLADLSSKRVMDLLLKKSDDKKDLKIFYSNNNVLADKAWMHFKTIGT